MLKFRNLAYLVMVLGLSLTTTSAFAEGCSLSGGSAAAKAAHTETASEALTGEEAALLEDASVSAEAVEGEVAAISKDAEKDIA